MRGGCRVLKAAATLALLFAAGPLRADQTLLQYAGGKPVRVYTYGTDEIPLGKGDNTNNFAWGDKILQLSRLNLTSLEGIASLQVLDQGKVRSIRDLEDLHLYVNGNKLRSLPAEFFTLKNLAVLYISFNRFEAIPPEIAGMRKLWGMYWTGNNIAAIPPEVWGMTWLRKFQVSKNRLTSLEGIGRLTELRHLNMADNLLERLPEDIGNLKLLRVCDLSGNRLRRLPEGFGAVPIVHQLRLAGNPLEDLPAGFANMPGSIDVTGTRVDVEKLPPALRAKIGTEKVVDDPDKKTRIKGPRKKPKTPLQ